MRVTHGLAAVAAALQPLSYAAAESSHPTETAVIKFRGLVPNRDIRLQLSGDVFGGHVSYALGYFNGVADGTSSDATADVDTDGNGDAAARLLQTARRRPGKQRPGASASTGTSIRTSSGFWITIARNSLAAPRAAPTATMRKSFCPACS